MHSFVVVGQDRTITSVMEVRSNRSLDADTHRPCAARRVDDPTPCGALPVRAGQLRR